MIQTVIFDMDGVIVDTEPIHKHAYFQHFSELNIDVSDKIFANFTGNSTRNVFEKVKLIFNLDYEVEELILRKRAIFNDAFHNNKDLELLEGVENLIKDLYKNGMQLILASSASKETIERVFHRFGLNSYFTHVVSGEDFPKSKPDPAIFEFAALMSIAPKENCIVIEDSTNGVLAAKAAGIYCVGYNSVHSKLQDLAKADTIVNHFDELNFEIIKNLS